jgi:hypothetical protein
MSDMSLKQAKEISERLELAELSLHSLLNNVEKSSKNFETMLKKQEQIFKQIPIMDKKLNNMKILIALNIGFIIGLVATKYFL